jgi:uncharacterized membrane protein
MSDSLPNPIATDQEQEKKARLQMVHTRTEGPLPPPATLAHYDNILPGLANRIVVMAEKEQQHAHVINAQALELEKEIRLAQNAYLRRGQYFAFTIAGACIAVTILLGCLGHDATAAVLGGTTIVGLATVFILGAYKQDGASQSQ